MESMNPQKQRGLYNNEATAATTALSHHNQSKQRLPSVLRSNHFHHHHQRNLSCPVSLKGLSKLPPMTTTETSTTTTTAAVFLTPDQPLSTPSTPTKQRLYAASANTTPTRPSASRQPSRSERMLRATLGEPLYSISFV